MAIQIAQDLDQLRAATGLGHDDYIAALRLLVAEQVRPQIVADTAMHPRFKYFPEAGEDPYHSFLGVPILRGGNTLGVLVVQNRAHRLYSEEEEEALQTTAMVLAEMIASGELQALAKPGTDIALRRPMTIDGQSLAGWTTSDGKPVSAGWELVDGVIHLTKGGPRGGNIITAEEFGDFDLSFEWKIAPKGNSGIKYRVRTYDNRWLGCEYQIYDDGTGKKVQSKNSAGALYDLYEPSNDKVLNPAGEYNTARIVVHGDHIEHWLNGKKLLSFNLDSPEVKAGIAKSKFKDEPGYGDKIAGHLMLTHHDPTHNDVWVDSALHTAREIAREAGATDLIIDAAKEGSAITVGHSARD